MHTLNHRDILIQHKEFYPEVVSNIWHGNHKLTVLEHSDSVFNAPYILTRCMCLTKKILEVYSKNYKCMCLTTQLGELPNKQHTPNEGQDANF